MVVVVVVVVVVVPRCTVQRQMSPKSLFEVKRPCGHPAAMEREACLLLRCQSPFVVKVFPSMEKIDPQAIRMELCDGTLASYMRGQNT